MHIGRPRGPAREEHPGVAPSDTSMTSIPMSILEVLEEKLRRRSSKASVSAAGTAVQGAQGQGSSAVDMQYGGGAAMGADSAGTTTVV